LKNPCFIRAHRPGAARRVVFRRAFFLKAQTCLFRSVGGQAGGVELGMDLIFRPERHKLKSKSYEYLAGTAGKILKVRQKLILAFQGQFQPPRQPVRGLRELFKRRRKLI
jgi:hypothetical protein